MNTFDDNTKMKILWSFTHPHDVPRRSFFCGT